MNNCDDYKGLLVGLIDQELTTDETREVNDHLIRCASCRDEFERLRETTGKLQSISFLEPQDVVLAKLWKSPFSRCTRNAGLFLVIGGYTTLLLFALYELLTKGDEAFIPRMALAAIVIGFFLLLYIIIRERVQTYKTDPYKEIKR